MDSSRLFAPSASSRLTLLAVRFAAPHRLRIALLVLAVMLLPLALPNRYAYDLAILVALNATVCIGLNLLIGYAGQISLGHAGFLGLGAYAAALLATRWGWPPLVAIVAAAAGVGVLAFAIGRPILRLRGHYLAMATLGFGIIVSIVIATEDRLTGGPDGMPVPPLSAFGVAVTGERAWYAVAVAVLVGAVWLAQNFIESPSGRALRALHASEIAAEVAGVETARHKLRVFVISAVYAAVAGALAAYYAGFVTPASASFLRSIELVTMVVFGGMASVFGAIVGAATLTILPHVLTVFQDYEMVVLGGVLMVTMIFMPRGVVPTIHEWWRRRSE